MVIIALLHGTQNGTVKLSCTGFILGHTLALPTEAGNCHLQEETMPSFILVMMKSSKDLFYALRFKLCS